MESIILKVKYVDVNWIYIIKYDIAFVSISTTEALAFRRALSDIQHLCDCIAFLGFSDALCVLQAIAKSREH